MAPGRRKFNNLYENYYRAICMDILDFYRYSNICSANRNMDINCAFKCVAQQPSMVEYISSHCS